MEEKITNILDRLDTAEAERLLSKGIKMDIDAESLARIKSTVYEKAGIKRRRHIFEPKKFVAAAAIFAIALLSIFAVEFDNVQAAINRLFSFIPGYSIIENNESIEYILSETAEAENEDVIFTLNNAIATRDSITVMVTLERKNHEARKDYEAPVRPKANLSLDVNGVKYTEYSGSTSGGGSTDTSALTYTLEASDIDTGTTYVLAHEDYGLSLAFNLKSYDSYNTLNEIGPTECKNDISITAVPTFKGDQLEVNLYPINKSGYAIDSFFQRDKGYLGDDLHLETNSGIKEYIMPGGHGSAHGKFVFDIEQGDKDFTLKIPFIIVQSTEEQNITLKIPKEGEKIQTNYEVDFKDCKMTIVELEKTSENMGDNGELKMTLKYDNKMPNQIMIRSNFYRTNIFGRIEGGGYASEIDQNGITTTVYFALEKGENNTLRLKASNPVYYLTDTYSLNLKI